MPRHATPKDTLFRKWTANHSELVAHGGVIFCTSCERSIVATKKHHVLQHCKSPGHNKATKATKSTPKPQATAQKQVLLTEFAPAPVSFTQAAFNFELCEALISANIPWVKLNNEKLKSFLNKYTQQHIPDESTLRKNYLPQCYAKVRKATSS